MTRLRIRFDRRFLTGFYSVGEGGSTCKSHVLAQINPLHVVDFSFDLFIAQSSLGKFLVYWVRMSVVSPTSRFAYESIRLHRGRFAYTTKVVSPTRSDRFASIEVDSPTLNTYY